VRADAGLTDREALMQRHICGYHRDVEGDWVAELDCGHNQHVRHNPPWTNRPWTSTDSGRAAHIGSALNCVKCDEGAPRDWLPAPDARGDTLRQEEAGAIRWGRVLAVWLLIALAESVHGTLRQIFLAPVVGDMPARQMAVLSGSAIIFLITWLCARWMALPGRRAQLLAGACWVLLTIAFEVGVGLSLGYSAERLLSDYDLRQGGLIGFGLLFMFFSPWLAARLRHARG
jgi:hypothetical protein